MIEKKKIKFNIISILTFVCLLLFSFKDNLLTSNFSRIANKSIKDYLLFFIISLLFGVMMFFVLNKQHLHKLKYLGLISLIVGGIVPYNYLDTNALSSNLHLIGAYLSICVILVCLLTSIYYFGVHHKKIADILFGLVVFDALIVLYLYGNYGFINSLAELIYLLFVIILEAIIYNVL